MAFIDVKLTNQCTTQHTVVSLLLSLDPLLSAHSRSANSTHKRWTKAASALVVAEEW